ncbi:hypothetical protein EDB85DRAFT_1958201, partial [Lactarius pseudohatsudake]
QSPGLLGLSLGNMFLQCPMHTAGPFTTRRSRSRPVGGIPLISLSTPYTYNRHHRAASGSRSRIHGRLHHTLQTSSTSSITYQRTHCYTRLFSHKKHISKLLACLQETRAAHNLPNRPTSYGAYAAAFLTLEDSNFNWAWDLKLEVWARSGRRASKLSKLLESSTMGGT